jgi:hypothetical protein
MPILNRSKTLTFIWRVPSLDLTRLARAPGVVPVWRSLHQTAKN